MKKIFFLVGILITVLFVFSVDSYAYDSKYAVHTSKKDIDLQKKKANAWYETTVNNKKFYWRDADKHISWLKNKALRWYENDITKEKFYFVHSDKESQFTKNKALRWFEQNNQ